MADNIPKKNKLKRKRIPNFKRIGKKYKEDTKENKLKIFHVAFIQIKNKIKYKPKQLKFSPENLQYYLQLNNHQSRKETKFEDDFSSSDSYDCSLFKLTGKIPRKYKLTKDNYKDNINNLTEIMRVLSLAYT